MDETAGAALYAERDKRVRDAIALTEPDRVPFAFFAHFWPATLAGITFEQAMYDYDKFNDAMGQALDLLQPDTFSLTQTIISLGPVLEMMDYKQLEWPGHGTDPNASYQYLDKEYMKADEFDDYLADPTGYFLRTYMPRIAGAFEPLAKLPTFPSLYYTKMIRVPTAFANPDVLEAIERIAEAGKEARKMVKGAVAFALAMEKKGFPQTMGAGAIAPFDFFADYMRGSKGAMLDMFRKGDKLLAAMDRAADFVIRDTIAALRNNPCKFVFIPLHWGLDGFMSPDQFSTFYWPPLRKVIVALIEADLIPCVLWEGNCTSRLEEIADVPAGKAIYWFESTDIFEAKAVLGGTVCIRGNVPASMLNTGSAEEVDAYCKKLIETVGKGGGFILDGAVGVPDEAKTENVVAMANSVRRYAH